MSMSLAILVNDRKLLPCLFHALGWERRRVPLEGVVHAGVGVYEQGEVLRTRRPLAEGVTLAKLLEGVDSNNILVHLESGPSRTFRPVAAQPYRFRDWMWAFSGELQPAPDFDASILALPSYVRESLRSDRPAEVLFHLFVAFLHGAGQLGRLQCDRLSVRKALGSALSYIGKHFEPVGARTTAEYAVIATNGEHLVATGSERPLYYQTVEGIADCRLCSERKEIRFREGRSVSHDQLRAVILTDGALPARAVAEGGLGEWKELPPGHVIDVDPALGIEVGPLGL